MFSCQLSMFGCIHLCRVARCLMVHQYEANIGSFWWYRLGPNAHPFFISVDFLSDQIMKSSYQIPYQSLNFLAISPLSDQFMEIFYQITYQITLNFISQTFYQIDMNHFFI